MVEIDAQLNKLPRAIKLQKDSVRLELFIMCTTVLVHYVLS